MVFTFISVALAVLALSFLIFIHELGHYFMARRVGMRVETFSIGFGHPLYKWERDGVKWQIGWLLFGGYVKIAGTDTDNGVDPYKVPDGFFGKSPFDRIKVAFMGPFVNIAFAFLVFTLLWVAGGRAKNFSEFTSKIGWVDNKSELFVDGVRPGDQIASYDGRSFQGFGDHMSAPTTASDSMEVKGELINYLTGEKQPFAYVIKPYPHPNIVKEGLFGEMVVYTSGIMVPANYIIYDKLPSGSQNTLIEGSPLAGSGIQEGDRIIWVDGDIIFSGEQMDHVLNNGKVLLTIKRGNDIVLARVPRVPVEELRLDAQSKDEFADWQFAAGLSGSKLQNLYAIPYNLTNDAVVEAEARFIDKDNQEAAFPKTLFAANDRPLQKGDKILAIDGILISQSSQLFAELQKPKTANIIVQRSPAIKQLIPWKDADADFDKSVDWKELEKIATSIGTGHTIETAGDLVLLKPVMPKTRAELVLTPEKQAEFDAELAEQKKIIAAIKDPAKRAKVEKLVDYQQKRVKLGLIPQDRKVQYNPTPDALFENVFTQIWRTLTALFTGSLNVEWLGGPVGIVKSVYDTSRVSLMDTLFWVGAISLNLGVLNLLPIPVLDGGTIVLSLFEMVTGKKIQPKTLEKLIIPFAVMLIGFFIFLTFNDVSKLFF